MKTFVIVASICIVSANALLAQQTSQSSVVGASGDSVYSVQVTGSDGKTYNCLPQLREDNGVKYRTCVEVGAVVSNGALTGGTLSGAGVGGAVVVALVVAAIAGGDGAVGTTTTSTSP